MPYSPAFRVSAVGYIGILLLMPFLVSPVLGLAGLVAVLCLYRTATEPMPMYGGGDIKVRVVRNNAEQGVWKMWKGKMVFFPNRFVYKWGLHTPTTHGADPVTKSGIYYGGCVPQRRTSPKFKKVAYVYN